MNREEHNERESGAMASAYPSRRHQPPALAALTETLRLWNGPDPSP